MTGREESRKPLRCYLRVLDRTDGTFVGLLADITAKGFMVLADRTPKEQDAFSLLVELPGEAAAPRGIELHAARRWCRKQPDSGFFRIGFQITGISPRDAQRVEQLIDRFRLEDAEGVSYDYNFDLENRGD